MIKLTIGMGTPVEVEDGEIIFEGGCVKLMGKVEFKEKDERFLSGINELILAYCLHPGEIVRRVSEGVYDVQQ